MYLVHRRVGGEFSTAPCVRTDPSCHDSDRIPLPVNRVHFTGANLRSLNEHGPTPRHLRESVSYVTAPEFGVVSAIAPPAIARIGVSVKF